MIRGSVSDDQSSMRGTRGPRDGCQNRLPLRKPPRQPPLPHTTPTPSPQRRASFTVKLHPSTSLPVQFGRTARRGRHRLSLAAEGQPTDRSRRPGDCRRERFDARQWPWAGRSHNLARKPSHRNSPNVQPLFNNDGACNGNHDRSRSATENRRIRCAEKPRPHSCHSPGDCYRRQSRSTWQLPAMPSLPGQSP